VANKRVRHTSGHQVPVGGSGGRVGAGGRWGKGGRGGGCVSGKQKGASHQRTPGAGRREWRAGRRWRPLLIHGSGARRRRPPRSAPARLAQTAAAWVARPRPAGNAAGSPAKRCPLLEPLGWGWKLCALRGSLRLLAATAGGSRRRRRRGGPRGGSRGGFFRPSGWSRHPN